MVTWKHLWSLYLPQINEKTWRLPKDDVAVMEMHHSNLLSWEAELTENASCYTMGSNTVFLLKSHFPRGVPSQWRAWWGYSKWVAGPLPWRMTLAQGLPISQPRIFLVPCCCLRLFLPNLPFLFYLIHRCQTLPTFLLYNSKCLLSKALSH